MSGKGKRTSYTPAYRREAAHLVIDTGRPIAVVAREVGLGEQLLGRWAGTVELDETYIGGEEPGLRGGRAKGKKALVGVAVELKEPRGYGRARMAILRDGSAASLHPFVTEHVEPGARLITDAWQGYRGIDKLGYTHEPRSQRAARARGQDPGEAAARGSPHRLPGHALAARHLPGVGR